MEPSSEIGPYFGTPGTGVGVPISRKWNTYSWAVSSGRCTTRKDVVQCRDLRACRRRPLYELAVLSRLSNPSLELTTRHDLAVQLLKRHGFVLSSNSQPYISYEIVFWR